LRIIGPTRCVKKLDHRKLKLVNAVGWISDPT
jgi:hypothetical protein